MVPAYAWSSHREAECEDLWDIIIQTDHVIDTDDQTSEKFIDKDNKRALVIDIAVSADARVEEKEQEKMDRSEDLAMELNRSWKIETKEIPIVVGALRTIAKGAEKNLKKVASKASVELLQKAAFRGISQILRMVLDLD